MVNVNYCILSGQLDIDKNYTHCMGVQQLLNATFAGGGGGGGTLLTKSTIKTSWI